MQPTKVKYGTHEDEWFEVRMVDQDSDGHSCCPHVILTEGCSPDSRVLSSDEAAELANALKLAAAHAARTYFLRTSD